MNLFYSLRCFLRLCLLSFSMMNMNLCAQPFVEGHLMGQLGNQFFQIAATVSLALDHDAVPIFPDLIRKSDYNIPINFAKVFSHLNHSSPPSNIEYTYNEAPPFRYIPIPYHPNMRMVGYFQSENFFINHKQVILDLFSPSIEIRNYLSNKYKEILNHPKSVSVHFRYFFEAPTAILSYDKEYLEKAMNLFPEDSLFVVFSNRTEMCKENLSGIKKNMVFIEGEQHYHDFYLMSMCRHNIICNSTFSWWAAYLNLNRDKIVIAPPVWTKGGEGIRTEDIIPDGWVVLK